MYCRSSWFEALFALRLGCEPNVGFALSRLLLPVLLLLAVLEMVPIHARRSAMIISMGLRPPATLNLCGIGSMSGAGGGGPPSGQAAEAATMAEDEDLAACAAPPPAAPEAGAAEAAAADAEAWDLWTLPITACSPGSCCSADGGVKSAAICRLCATGLVSLVPGMAGGTPAAAGDDVGGAAAEDAAGAADAGAHPAAAGTGVGEG